MIVWTESSITKPPIVESEENWKDYVFIGCLCKGLNTDLKKVSLCDLLPMIRDKQGYKYALSPYFPITTEPKWWTTDINLPTNTEE